MSTAHKTMLFHRVLDRMERRFHLVSLNEHADMILARNDLREALV